MNDRNQTINTKRINRIFIRVFILLFVFAFLYDHIRNKPIADKIKNDLEAEYNLIDHFPGASSTRYEVTAKTGNALVIASFKFNNDFNEIKLYYDGELEENGWKFWKIDRFEDRVDDLEENYILFCKDSYIATITHYGKNSDHGSTYSLSLSWGLDVCQ